MKLFPVFLVMVLCTSPTWSTTVWTPDNPDFRTFYQWDDLRDGEWTWFQTPQGVAVHLFQPWKKPSQEFRGTLFLLHGYLEHGGTQVKLAREGVKAGWLVVALDLPGHGLSSGPRADISSFRDYARAFKEVMNQTPWPQPLRAAGHSTGASAILELLQSEPRAFEKIWLTAPLVRSWMWELSMAVQPVMAWAFPRLPNRGDVSSRVQDFNHFLSQDPLRGQEVPAGWVSALRGWEATTQTWTPGLQDLEILQGTGDTVVDWRYNTEFLKKKWPAARLHLLEGAWHNPFHDEPETARISMDLFRKWLDS